MSAPSHQLVKSAPQDDVAALLKKAEQKRK
jgi:hypothetical protein